MQEINQALALVEIVHGIQLVDQAEALEHIMRVILGLPVDQAVAEVAVATEANQETLVMQEDTLHPKETQADLEGVAESLDTPAAVAEPTNPVTLQPL